MVVKRDFVSASLYLTDQRVQEVEEEAVKVAEASLNCSPITTLFGRLRTSGRYLDSDNRDSSED